MKMFAATVALAVLCSANLALANGPSKGNNGSVRVTNTSQQPAVVIVDPSQATLAELGAGVTQARFRQLGGRILNAAGGAADPANGIDGPTITLGNLAVGDRRIFAALVPAGGGIPNLNQATNRLFPVTRGGTTQATIGGNGAAVTLADLLPANFGRDGLFASLALAGFGALGFAGYRLGRSRS